MTSTSIFLLVIVTAFLLWTIIEGIMIFRKIRSLHLITFVLLTIGVVFDVFLVTHGKELTAKDWAAMIPTIGLVLITAIYAWSTEKMAQATKIQADASVKLAEQTKEQHVITTRPWIIQKSQQQMAIGSTIITDYFSHFEIYNAGNTPAIELEIFLLNEEKNYIFAERVSYLRTGESPIKLLPSKFDKVQTLPDIEPPIVLIPKVLFLRDKTTYLVSQYQSVVSYKRQPEWYQTWLPFESTKASKDGEIYIKPGELEFKVVDVTTRINVFSESKPK
jgi:hypothetical protein